MHFFFILRLSAPAMCHKSYEFLWKNENVSACLLPARCSCSRLMSFMGCLCSSSFLQTTSIHPSTKKGAPKTICAHVYECLRKFCSAEYYALGRILLLFYAPAPHQLTMALNLSLFHIFCHCTGCLCVQRCIAQCDFDAEDNVGFTLPCLLRGERASER